MSDFGCEIKINNQFYNKLSSQTQKQFQSYVLDRVWMNCYGYIKAGGIGKLSPSGGAPVSIDGNENTSYYMGYLRDSHNFKKESLDKDVITSSAFYWKDVVNGYRPPINQVTGKFFEDVNPYVPNPYHKRAIDNAIKNRVPQQATSEAMRMFGFKK